MGRVRIALVGVGNCASSLVQGIEYYRRGNHQSGLMHDVIGGYAASDIDVVCAFDTDARKVGLDVSEAIFARPNCTAIFQPEVPASGAQVRMGRRLDGMASHMMDLPNGEGFVAADLPDAELDEVVAALRDSGADVLINFLPVGSEEATRFYMECALKAGVAVVNCMPVFIASNPEWEKRFAESGIPIIGDDVKAQIGATIVHRTLCNLFRQRGARIDRTYQLNTGGNTDFMNMLDRSRLLSKKESKTEAVQTILAQRLADRDIHVGPSDYVPWLDDNKLCFLRIEGALFGDVPMNIEVRLSVEDSPNSAAVVIDAIRCCKVALDRGEGGAIIGPSAFFCKHPPEQFNDDIAYEMTERYIGGPAAAAE